MTRGEDAGEAPATLPAFARREAEIAFAHLQNALAQPDLSLAGIGKLCSALERAREVLARPAHNASFLVGECK